MKRILSLEGLRVIAIFIIILSHLEFIGDLNNKFGDFYIKYLHNATLGVDFFFLLSGFGLMLRDDCYLPAKVDVSTNYVASGVLVQSSGTYFNWKRESTALGLSENTTTHAFVAGDEIEFSITRVGQTVTCVTTYNGTAYSTIYTDFDFVATDSDYMYVGMFANRGTVVTFTNLNFQITGDSQGA